MNIINKLEEKNQPQRKPMERLDQGHLHPLLDKHVSAGNRTRAACVTGEHSSYFKQLT
jgi:hypothetical protein